MDVEASHLLRRLKATVVVAAMAGLVGLILFGFAAPAQAVLAGENGRIVFVSGRPPETDATARLYLLPVPSNSSGGGVLSNPITPPGGQYRHPSWSPDRTKIVYANGNPAMGIFDLFVQDLEAGTGPVQITPTEGAGVNNLSADRPAWSPDGTRIVYEHQPSAGSTDRHIRVQPADDLQLPIPTTDLTAAGAPFEGKPAWTPDSQTVYFHRNDPATVANSDIYRKPAIGGTETLALPDSSISEAQPSISPDGQSICFTRTNQGFNSSADVVVAPLANPASATIVSKSVALGDYNCTWSPDGQMIAYVNGVFSTGRLVMVRADNTSLFEIDLADDVGFDGNPDWAPDGRPECPDKAVTTQTGQPVTFTVDCVDTGPTYELSEVRVYADSQPTGGTLEQEFAGDPFTYTPNAGFSGTDSFEVNSFDELGFGIDRGTVSITVQPPKKPLPPIKNPTNTTAVFDGRNLHIRLKCPARFKPRCLSTAVPVTKKRGGKVMARAKKVITKSNRFKRVSFLIKPAFRARVEKMTYVNRKQLVTRQVIRSKRVGKRKARNPSRVFHTYKVRLSRSARTR